MPTALHQAASLSADAMSISIAFVLTSYILTAFGIMAGRQYLDRLNEQFLYALSYVEGIHVDDNLRCLKLNRSRLLMRGLKAGALNVSIAGAGATQTINLAEMPVQVSIQMNQERLCR